MKREIKFRAWDVVAKHIIYDPQVTVLTDDLNKQFTIDANEYEWMQYTGLKDKNGKEIYEGDVLYCSDAPGSHHRIFWNNERGGWDDERLEDGDSNTSYYGFDSFMDCEVIGNIYENAELISK